MAGGGGEEEAPAGPRGEEDGACACGSPKARGINGQGEGSRHRQRRPRFFVVHGDAPWLDGRYAVFGMVTEGRDTVDRLASVELEGGRFPEQPADPSETRVRTVLVP